VRKTLHAHFLIWVKNWSKALDGLSDPAKRDKFAEELKTFAGKVASAKFHDDFEKLVCSNPECSNLLKDNHKECSNQDLREIRCSKGTTQFGDKSILLCTLCNRSYTSEDLAVKSLDNCFNSFLLYLDRKFSMNLTSGLDGSFTSPF
jgi:hypothetical protein